MFMCNKWVQWSLAIGIFAIALHRYHPVPVRTGACGTGYEGLELGCSLALKGTFSDPFLAMPTGPSAHLAPLFPATFAIVIRAVGTGPEAILVLQWIAALALAIQLALWPFAAKRLGMGFAAGALGAAAWLLIRYTLYPMWEAVYVAALTLLIACLVCHILTERFSPLHVVITGLVCGVALLFNPVTLIVFAALGVLVGFSARIPRVVKLLLFAVPVLMISPWLVRNFGTFHHFVPIRDNFGLELSIGNNPCSTFWFLANEARNCYDHPNTNRAEAMQVRTLGEYEYNQHKLREALRWIRDNPRHFVGLTVRRFAAFWLPSTTGNPFAERNVPPKLMLTWVLVLMGIPGMWLLWRRSRISAGICLLWLVFFPPVYYFIQFDARYRFPIIWAIFLPACFLVTEVVGEIWKAVSARAYDQ